jgi:hypothetical protein
MTNETKITCPNCGGLIDVNNALVHQLEDELNKKYQNIIAEERKKQRDEYGRIEKIREELEKQKEDQDKVIADLVKQKLDAQRIEIEKRLKSKLEEEQSEQFAILQNELNQKSEQIKELNKTKAEIEKLKREKEELKESIEASAQKRLNEELVIEKEKIRRSEHDRNEMIVNELKKQLEDQKRLTEEMKRKQEQGSMQLQGEVQELAIEDWLQSNFPLDTINEIKKGDRGADCIQIVNTRTNVNCGAIYYESKRTKEFKSAWLEKFREDMREKGVSIGVLVTDVYPKGHTRMILIDGIWVCSFEEFKGLCMVLRETIIQLHKLIAGQENKGDKMSMLYEFLTGNEFTHQVEAIVEGFTQMQIDLAAEKKSITGHWKRREKQIQKVLINTTNMYNSIKGIAGNAIQTVQALELPEADIEDLDEID